MKSLDDRTLPHFTGGRRVPVESDIGIGGPAFPSERALLEFEKSQHQRQMTGAGAASARSFSRPGPRQVTAAAPAVGRFLDRKAGSSHFRIDQSPGHRPNLVEEFQGGVGSYFVDSPSFAEKSQMTVNFFSRGVGDSIMVRSISTSSTVTFGEIGRN